MSPPDTQMTLTAAPVASPGAASDAWPTSRPMSRLRRIPRNVWTVAIVVLIGVIAFTSAGRLLRPSPIQDITLYTVAQRSFPVLLEEKGELQAANSIDIRCELEGKSTIIYLIEEGTHAKKGDLLVELASDAIDESIRETEIKEANAQAAYEAAVKEQEILQDENASKIRKAALALEIAEIAEKKYKEGDAVELRQTANLALEKCKSVLKRAEEDLKDSTDLYQQGFVTRIDLENDRFKAFEAQLELKKAELALDVLEKYTIPMNLREKESDVTEARKELEREKKSAEASEAKSMADVAGKKSELQILKEKLDRLRDQKAKAKILAPADGLVVYARSGSWHSSDRQIMTGASVFERQSLIELPDTSSMMVVVRVHEAQTEHLNVGLPAVIEVEGFTGRRFTGTVSKIAVLADSQNRWLNPNLKEYETEILLDGTFKDLKPGITARAQVQLAQLSNVLAVPVQSVFGKGNRYYVFLQEGESSRPVEVTIGLASNEYVEIKDGLKAGQTIRLAVSDELKLMLPETIGPEKAEVKPLAAAAAETPRAEPAKSEQGESGRAEAGDSGEARPQGSGDRSSSGGSRSGSRSPRGDRPPRSAR